MNAAQHLRPGLELGALVDVSAGPEGQDERLSALLDGELSMVELDDWLLAQDADGAVQTACRRYQLIGQVMRAEPLVVEPTSPQDFLAGVRARLSSAPASAMAPSPAQPAAQPRGVAANDAVFRWKLVAGVASLAAVMAVSWSVLGGAPGPAGGVTPGPQMAQVPSGALGGALPGSGQANPGAASATLVVNTERGPVLRDPRLEELLAEHRQYGGVSALQMPAGFLRDATHQSDPQR